MYRLHEKVNNKLKVNYNVSYNDIVDRYESYRSKCGKIDKKKKGCVTPLDIKSSSFKVANYKETPLISYKTSKKFIKYAKERNIDNKYFKFVNNKNKDVLIDNNNNKCVNRNIYCRNIIKNMRENSIPSLEESGKYKGLPTIDETKLILGMSSNLNKDELYEIVNKLKVYKKYKLVK
mgnify:CR=1 FL=1